LLHPTQERVKRDDLLKQARNAGRGASEQRYGSAQSWDHASEEMDAEVQLCDLDWTVKQQTSCFTSNSVAPAIQTDVSIETWCCLAVES
jgi:hypothetical protein